MYYVNIFDLLFNGAESCEMTNERPVHGPYVEIRKDYDFPRGRDVYVAFYRGVCLGKSNLGVTIGFLNGILNSLKGKGEWVSWSFDRGDVYRPFTRKQRQKIKGLGLWSF